MIALPRTSRAAAAVAVMMATCLVLASPAMAKSKAPVKLDGKVTNKGVGAAKNGTAQIEAHNYYFDKTFVKTAAGPVTVELENAGTAPHTFTIDDQNIDVVLAPGAKKTVTVQASATEPVTFYCRFHVGSGMQGALFVKAGGTASGSSSTKSDSKSNGKSGGYDYAP